MPLSRLELLKQLRESSPADLRSALLDEGLPPEEVQHLFATLPVRRLGIGSRAILWVVLFVWAVAVFTQVAYVVSPTDISELAKGVVGTVLSCAFFLSTKRLMPQCFGVGMVWLMWIVGLTVVEIDELTAAELSDPFLMGGIWIFLGVFVLGILGMGTLKQRLYPDAPWLPLRPMRPDSEVDSGVV